MTQLAGYIGNAFLLSVLPPFSILCEGLASTFSFQGSTSHYSGAKAWLQALQTLLQMTLLWRIPCRGVPISFTELETFETCSILFNAAPDCRRRNWCGQTSTIVDRRRAGTEQTANPFNEYGHRITAA